MAQISAVLLLVMLISGCATHLAPVDSTYQMSHPELEQALTWRLAGKIGIKSSEGGANLGFVWKQMPDRYEITLTGALGSGRANLIGNSEGVTLTLPNGDEYQSDDISELLDNQMGYPIPVSHLRYWLRGIPDPDYDYRLSSTGFTQKGWEVNYRKFNSTGPDKIQIEQGSTRVKLVALKWQY